MNRLEQMYARWEKDEKVKAKKNGRKPRKFPNKIERKKLAKQFSKNAVLAHAVSVLWRKIARDWEDCEKEVLSAVK